MSRGSDGSCPYRLQSPISTGAGAPWQPMQQTLFEGDQHTPMNGRALSILYQRAHDRMRDGDGLQPHEAFDELLKFLFYRDCVERQSGGGVTPVQEDPGAVRERLSRELASEAPWSLRIWPGGRIHLSDSTLLDIQHLFADVRLTELPLDVRSAALSTFLTPGVRKALGIFPTPDGIVRSMVEIAAPSPGEVVLDPACGTGTFLLEAVRFVSAQQRHGAPVLVHGIDKSPRMVFLADLNLGREPGVAFYRACADSLRDFAGSDFPPLGLSPDSVDVILTNPPFGVTVTPDARTLEPFRTPRTGRHRRGSGIPSEILFTEFCLRMLRPGGRLGIVLPRSVITNERLGRLRRAIDQIGRLTEIVDLPPETFVSTGAGTTTVAAFFRKHTPERVQREVQVRTCRIANVGFDTTGRHKDGSELPALARSLAEPNPTHEPTVTIHGGIPQDETLQRAAALLFRHRGKAAGKQLRDFIALANTGRTPPRSAYAEGGPFILKVGNLTGRGIDWSPRERNFVSQDEGLRRSRSPGLGLRQGDILLTSSAHAARYIAKKVDILDRIPPGYEGPTFVGELIRLRPADGVDPFVLLAALRHPRVRQDLQACVRGQTAHLSPNDLLEVAAPCDLRAPSQELEAAAELLRLEADLAFRLSSVAAQATELLESTSTARV